MCLFSLRRQGHAYGATCCARSRDFFAPRTRASFAHSWAASPRSLRGLDFLFPYVNSEGFHLRTVSRSRRGYFDVFCSSVWRVSTLFRDLRILFTRPAVVGSLTYFLSLGDSYRKYFLRTF